MRVSGNLFQQLHVADYNYAFSVDAIMIDYSEAAVILTFITLHLLHGTSKPSTSYPRATLLAFKRETVEFKNFKIQ